MSGKTTRAATLLTPQPAWQEHSGTVYRCQIYVLPPSVPVTWKASAAALPNLSAEGQTEQEALANITSALAAVLASHKQAGEKIPWVAPAEPAAPEALSRWVFVRL